MMELQIKYLITDCLVHSQVLSGGIAAAQGNGLTVTNDQLILTLTPQGAEFPDNLYAGIDCLPVT